MNRGLRDGLSIGASPTALAIDRLGVQLGVATIHDLSLTCGATQVVY